eukprot:2015419-Karenia_brevis.AAC.1
MRKEPQEVRGGGLKRRRIERTIGKVERFDIEEKIDKWIQEIKEVVDESSRYLEELEEEEELGGAWDDVHGGETQLKLVKESRKEEVTFIEGKP